VCLLKHVELSINFGIINSITKLHLVGISTEFRCYVGVSYASKDYDQIYLLRLPAMFIRVVTE
jgi:predicted amino acid racemase